MPIVVDEQWVKQVSAQMPEMPDARQKRFIAQYDLTDYDAELLTVRKDVADYFERAVTGHNHPKALSNWIVGELFRVLKDRKLDEQFRISTWPVSANQLAELVHLIDEGSISGKIAKTVFDAMLDSDKMPRQIVTEKGLEQVSDSSSLEQAVDQVLAASGKQIEQFRAGNEKVFGYFVGLVV